MVWKNVLRMFTAGMLVLSGNVFADAVNFKDQTITVALTQEPPSLNTIRMTDLVSFFIIGHTNEGLLRYDRYGRLAPGVAESWETTPTGILFKLRPDARWSDGSPVIADDFVFAWQRINDPLEAAPFAAIMYPIKNAEQIQKGELPPSALGMKAIDNRTLQIDFEFPCGYCPGLMPHATFFPIKRSFYEEAGKQYGADAHRLLANGPFQLTHWTHSANLRLRKNPNYWDRNNITLQEINIGYITEDNRTRLNLFADNRIALVRLGAETVKDASALGLRLRTFQSGGLSYLRFNMIDTSITRYKKLRQAIQSVFDPETFVNRVIAIPGYQPAYSFFPSWLRGVQGKFADEYPVPPNEVDIEHGRQLIRELQQDLGGNTIPEVTLLSVASPTGAKVAEFFQGLLHQSLGLRVKVDQQTLKQYLDKSRKGQFDIAVSSWYPDFDDIMTYADLQASWNHNNRGNYVNPVYDRHVRVLQGASDTRQRMDAAAVLQDILLQDVPVLPVAETGSAYIQHPDLKGVIRRVIGQDPDYTYAWVVN